MKAIQINAFGGPEAMHFVNLDEPVASPGFEVIDVKAIGVNYADTHQTENSYLSPQKLPLVPGIEVVGITVDGRRVLTPVVSGGYAQKALAFSESMIEVPDGVSDSQALCMLVQGSTAWHILTTVGHLKPGESVVIHAAAGGVGTIAIQLAKLWGAKVIAVASTQSKRDLAKTLGADVAIDADQDGLLKAILEANNGKPVDLVLEMIGGKTFDESLAALANFGRIVTYGMASRSAASPIHPGSLMIGSKTVSGFWLANCFGSKELLDDPISELFKLVRSGELKPVIGATFGLSQAVKAHQMMLARKTTGKITLDPAS